MFWPKRSAKFRDVQRNVVPGMLEVRSQRFVEIGSKFCREAGGVVEFGSRFFPATPDTPDPTRTSITVAVGDSVI